MFDLQRLRVKRENGESYFFLDYIKILVEEAVEKRLKPIVVSEGGPKDGIYKTELSAEDTKNIGPLICPTAASPGNDKR